MWSDRFTLRMETHIRLLWKVISHTHLCYSCNKLRCLTKNSWTLILWFNFVMLSFFIHITSWLCFINIYIYLIFFRKHISHRDSKIIPAFFQAGTIQPPAGFFIFRDKRRKINDLSSCTLLNPKSLLKPTQDVIADCHSTIITYNGSLSIRIRSPKLHLC